MAEKQKKSKKEIELEAKIAELTADLQRTRADFENYRKHADSDKVTARELGRASAVLKLLPVIDNIERAISHLPEELKQNQWALGIVNLSKNLDKSLEDLGLKRIEAKSGTTFDPELHDAIQIDESSEGNKEVVSEELQAGYLMDGRPIRHAMVKVKRV